MAESRICSIDGCDKPHEAFGLCQRHYIRFYKYGDALLKPDRQTPTCSVEGCGEPFYSKNYCHQHYNKFYQPIPCYVDGCGTRKWKDGLCKKHHIRLDRTGDPLQELGPTKLRAFVEKAVQCKDEECLIYSSREKEPRSIIRVNGKNMPLARYVCELAHGSPPTPEHEAAHNCGKGHIGCVNANHLRWATKIENERDKLIHGTHIRGTRHYLTRLSEADVREIRARAASGEKRNSIAEHFAVSVGCISNITLRRSWAWLE